MDINQSERLIQLIEEIKHDVDEKTAAKLQLDLNMKLAKRLDSFSKECEECKEGFLQLESQMKKINDHKEELTKDDIKEHYKLSELLSSHLQNEHKLIPNGYYMGIYMSIGLSIGLLIGLFLFDNIAIGLPLGMVLGMAVGMAKDSEAKKKGEVI